MSDIDLNQKMESLKVGRRIPAYTGVIVHAGKNAKGKDVTYQAGNTSGYVLEFDNPYGTQAMAGRVLAGLAVRGVPYQPFESLRTDIDPALEIGDGLTVDGASAVAWAIKTPHGDLLAADVSAPYDEELSHEFKYTPRSVREFRRESTYTRSRLALNEDSIQLEVLRAQDAERNLGSRIDMRVDSITLSVTSRNGSSTFTLKDGSTTLDSKTVEITCDALNISGQLTASQIAAGAITIGKLDADAQSKMVVESQARTQYYLSTSSSSATGGSWSNTIPTWTSGKYIWTRERTYNKYADGSSVYKYSPDENGRYDKNLTEARGDADGAQAQGGLIYRSTSGGSAPSAPTAWVTDSTGDQNKWTTVRPEYSSDYPALYVATQKQTVGGTYSCTTPKLDATTTVIDGAHIITGTIDASKIAVADLSALNATIGGWTISSTRLEKEIASQLARVRIQAPANPTASSLAISVGTRETTSDSYAAAFSVSYGGKVKCTDIEITGGEMKGGKVGGIDVGTTSFGGYSPPSSGTNKGKLILPAANIADGAISGAKIANQGISAGKFYPKCIDTGDFADEAVTTAKVSGSIETSLSYADNFNEATKSIGYTYTPPVLRANVLYAANSIETAAALEIGNAAFKLGGSTVEKKSITVRNSAGTGTTTLKVLVWS